MSDDDYFGIATARLSATATLPGAAFPMEIPYNIVRIRQAQAITFERNKSWKISLTSAVIKATESLLSDEIAVAKHLKVNPLHGGGARSLVLNVDEIISNVALEKMGSMKGEYHSVASLVQLDKGSSQLETFLTAVHITLIEEITIMNEAIESLLKKIKQQANIFQKQGTVATLQFQEVEISTIGAEFFRCYESLLRSRQQLEWFRACLLPCWQGPPEALLALRGIVGIDLAVSKAPHDFPWNVDLYVRFSSFLKVTAMLLLCFCNKMKVLIGCSKELDLPRRRANSSFNPAGRDFLIPDTVSQLVFSIVGADATVSAAAGASVDGAMAYVPLFSSQLVWATKWLTSAMQLLDEKFVDELTGEAKTGSKIIAETPLQAEKLVSVLGYDRAVQVARIASLTKKPVRTVVSKMKLLTEEQLDQYLPATLEEEGLP
ncbi:MAG TPA: hypothetical protein VN631_03385 [Negativicutes bacterium]|nr:hypothetical protein [Negativicutes bacterium]